MSENRQDKPVRKSLRSEIAEIDQQILRLLLKRHNLLGKIRVKGRIDPGEEKFLRESWQTEVSKVSRDPELSGRFFSLLQNLNFLPRPAKAAPESGGNLPGALRRDAFNLAPPRQPVAFAMVVPLDSMQTRSWMFMAACAGMPMRLAPTAQNDPIIDFIKALVQMGGAITRDEESAEAVIIRAAEPLGTPDKVIHVGESAYNFYLCVARYLGSPSHVKFTGGTKLKLEDFSSLGRLLPSLGARLVHVVPRSSGLPARLECSGILPAGVRLTSSIAAEFAQALILAAPFYGRPFAVSLAEHPQKGMILARTMPILEKCGVSFVLNGESINLEPASLHIPQQPQLPADMEIASFLLALAAPLGGKVELAGKWPDTPAGRAFWRDILASGLPWEKDDKGLKANNEKPLENFVCKDFNEPIAENQESGRIALFTALAASAALNSGRASLPPAFAGMALVEDFLGCLGLAIDAGGGIANKAEAGEEQVWNAPTPAWAMALAVTALARGKRGGFSLANPGIVTELWPSFWACYNKLPNPRLKKSAEPAEAPVKRRRILTNVVAVPPEIKEEDWQ